MGGERGRVGRGEGGVGEVGLRRGEVGEVGMGSMSLLTMTPAPLALYGQSVG